MKLITVHFPSAYELFFLQFTFKLLFLIFTCTKVVINQRGYLEIRHKYSEHFPSVVNVEICKCCQWYGNNTKLVFTYLRTDFSCLFVFSYLCISIVLLIFFLMMYYSIKLIIVWWINRNDFRFQIWEISFKKEIINRLYFII